LVAIGPLLGRTDTKRPAVRTIHPLNERVRDTKGPQLGQYHGIKGATVRADAGHGDTNRPAVRTIHTCLG